MSRNEANCKYGEILSHRNFSQTFGEISSNPPFLQLLAFLDIKAHLTVIDIPNPSALSLWITTVLGSPIPLLFLALLSASSSSFTDSGSGGGGGGAGVLLLGSFRPLHALITVLCLCKCISASIWFHSWSCSLPLISRPRSWICWILKRRSFCDLTGFFSVRPV